MEGFRAYLQSNRLSIPEGYFNLNSIFMYRYDDENRLVLRILDGTRYKYKETYELILAHHKFVTTTFPTAPSLA